MAVKKTDRNKFLFFADFLLILVLKIVGKFKMQLVDGQSLFASDEDSAQVGKVEGKDAGVIERNFLA